MKRIVNCLGAIVVSLIMYSTPVVTTLAFALGWSGTVKFILTIAAMMQLVMLTYYIEGESK